MPPIPAPGEILGILDGKWPELNTHLNACAQQGVRIDIYLNVRSTKRFLSQFK